MVADYWLVHKCKVDVPAMYDPNGRYRYWNGINWRAAVALAFSVIPSIPGLISSINSKIQVGNDIHLFDIAWLYGFFVAGFFHWSLSTLFPAHETYMDAAVIDMDAAIIDVIESKNDIDSHSRSSDEKKV